MVKIIGEATEVYKKITCEMCAAILEYTPSEVKLKEGRDHGVSTYGREWIDCPRCGKEVTIKTW